MQEQLALVRKRVKDTSSYYILVFTRFHGMVNKAMALMNGVDN